MTFLRSKYFDVIAGFCISCVIVWGLGAIFRTSPSLFSFDSRLGLALRTEGSIKQERTENWVTNRYGKLGLEISNAVKLDSPLPKTVILGDSYIEAEMIPGSRQMQNMVTLLGTDCLSIGYSGIGGAEYCYLMRHLPCVIPNIATFIIFIGDVFDLKGENPDRCRVDSLGAMPRNSSSRLDCLTVDFRLYALRSCFRRWRLYKIDFWGNHWLRKTAKTTQDKPQWLDSLPAVCRELKRAAGGRTLLIVYAPHLPYIEKSRIEFEDKELVFGRELETICRKLDIDFINLQKNFQLYYKKTGKFPRGFFNTPPGDGHLNEAGHSIAAREISRFFQGKN